MKCDVTPQKVRPKSNDREVGTNTLVSIRQQLIFRGTKRRTYGRTKKEIPKEFHEVAHRWKKKEISIRQGAKNLGISHTLPAKWLKEEKHISTIKG
ncbi:MULTISPECIES: hypothetical protein [Terrabacteria group]|uniref:hypothetical protein n=1 Tax=Bacillati TaxID=1783272 RepID=UPI001C6F0D22|nr:MULTISPECIES: hypothetical protein [Terrabacteria group]MBW9213010.1 hypothetical protein [Trueperella sp. zg.1013]